MHRRAGRGAAVTTAVAIAHLAALRFPTTCRPRSPRRQRRRRMDLRGTVALVAGVPGLAALIAFTTINNVLGGVFMALMDPYGLSLVSVEVWGLLWGVLSTGMIIVGVLVSRRGLGRNPLRAMLLANVAIWSVCSVFTMRSSIMLLAVGMFRVPARHARHRGGRADRAAEGGAVRAAGQGVRASRRASSRPRRR